VVGKEESSFQMARTKQTAAAKRRVMIDNAVVAWMDFHAADASHARAQIEGPGMQWRIVTWSREWQRLALAELSKPCMFSNVLPEDLRAFIVQRANH